MNSGYVPYTPNVPPCNCGRRGTPHEGHCVYCMEKDQSWRIWQTVKQVMASALLAAGKR